MRKRSFSVRAAATTTAVMAASLLALADQDVGQRPVFRSGVELVTVDVNVVDRRGQPVRGLSSSDFTVMVDGRPRRVVSAEFVDAAAAKAAAAARPDLATISSNEGAAVGRQVVFVVDQSTLETSSARYVARAAERFFSQLTFADRSGLIVLPVGQNISLTWSHDQVQASLLRLSGMSGTLPGGEYGSLTEARDIANRNMTALQTAGQRECATPMASGRGGGANPPGGTAPPPGSAPPPGGGTGGGSGTTTSPPSSTGVGAGMDSCLRNLQVRAEMAWRVAYSTSLSSVASLRQAFETLGRVRGDKTVILISGGWPLEPYDEVSALRPLASAAAAARVTLFPVFVPRSRFSVSQSTINATPGQDQFLYSGPLQVLANFTGGEFYRAEVNAETVFEQIARELAAYYRVGIERQAGDQDGKARKLDVSVSRSGSTVRARSIFDPRTFDDRNWAARLASALDSPIPADGIPLRVTSYVTLDREDRSRLNVTLVGTASRVDPGDATVRVVVRDLEGRKILSGEPPTGQATEHGFEFAVNVPVPPGRYVVRVGVMDSGGHVGSVEHRVEAQPVRVGPLTATGPLLVLVPGRAGLEPRIALGSAAQDERLAMELGLEGNREDVENADIVFEIASSVDGPPLINSPAALTRGAFDGAYLAQAVADLRVLPPGEYVARARVRAGAGTAGELRRWFVVTGMPSVTTSGAPPGGASVGTAAPAPLSVRAIGAVQPFALDHVLAAPILGAFLDRVAARPDAASPMIQELVQRARREGIEQLPVSDTLAAEYPVAAFLRGVKLFAAQRFEAAAASFRAAMRTSPDMFPAMVYLGACYAAGGKDKEAAGAWQTALIGTGDTVDVHRLLADALLRQGSAERALQAVERARAKWPEDQALRHRFVVAALLGGKPAEGLRTLDALIEKQDDVDEGTLALALLVLYESFERQQPIEGAAADRARMLRLAEQYRSTGGPSLALIEAWIAAVAGKG